MAVVLATVRGAALGGLLAFVVVGGLNAKAPSARPGATAEGDAYERVVERAAADHRCSFAGFGDRAVPSSALIRNAHGQLRQVSFEVGWDVYNGKRPGQLIAVCLDDTRDSEVDRAS